jgi:hypothetical protein
METTVDDPQEGGGLMSKYTTYRVSCTGRAIAEGGSTAVRRRFNDFVWLRERLSARYPGICVPPLPGAGGLRSHGKAFIKKRMAMLSAFLEGLTRHPILAGDKSFGEFLDVEAGPAWKMVTKKKGNVSEERDGNASETQWRDAVTSCEVDTSWQSLDVISMAGSEIDTIIKALKGIKASVKSLIEREAVYAGAVNELHGAVAGWLDTETTGVRKLGAGGGGAGGARPMSGVLDVVCGKLAREEEHQAIQVKCL